ncbi:unnamed protein product [Polarella glacialis]|uniref:Uncharacterized protein n=1 Tax=Polarella glacialis TaxID=89957 RepID=A0A813IZ40_POLGL|nr:unnamed protein product [Polarella glacialis]CAE8662102.1 unnamed protein product [Polarella glacialis]
MSLRHDSFYDTYHGHEVDHLKIVHHELRRSHRSVIFLAGDSSLDNKYWLEERSPAVNGYERILSPAQMKQDICFWLNKAAVDRGMHHLCCLNTAIEATALSSRACGKLLEQDHFIRDHITEDDYLVVSIGGNDIALMPVLCTILNLLALSWCTPVECLKRCACACPVNSHTDLGCLDCGLLSCLLATPCGWPPGVGYFVDLFGHKVQNYVCKLVGERKPKKVIVCMIYYLDQVGRDSWADCALRGMGYDCCPWRLQAAISTIFTLATQKIQIPGTEVVGFPLFNVLDGRTSEDYVQRVEPSAQGGRKMASALMEVILTDDHLGSASCGESGSESAPHMMAMGC